MATIAAPGVRRVPALMRSAATVGGFTLVSRLLGFARDVLVASVLGAGPVADAFFVAFKLPNLFRRLFAEGAFNAAFVPLFARRIEEQGLASARRFAERVLALLLAALLGLTIAAEIAMPAVMRGLAPGFAADPDKLALATLYGRITFPYLLLLSLTALCGGMLNALHRYAAAAAAPIALNVVLILALMLVAPALGRPGAVLAWAVLLAGMVQLVWLVWACRRAGLAPRLHWPQAGADLRRFFRLLLPAAGSAGLVQVNLLVGNVIASHQPGAVSFLYYADRLYQLPLGVIGIAVGVVLLPELARRLRGGDAGAAQRVQAQAIGFAALLTLPAAGALLALAGPLVAVLFQRGAFGIHSAQATAAALAAFACGLPAFVLIKLLSPGFFAREDTATPMRCALAAVVANVVLGIGLFVPFGHVGVALATTLAGWLQAGLLGAVLHRRGHLGIGPHLRRTLGRTALAAGIMAVGLRFAAGGLADRLAGAPPARAAALAGLIAGGAALYFGLVFALGLGRRVPWRRRPAA